MRLCIVSDLGPGMAPGARSDVAVLCRYATTWVQEGHDVYWVTAPSVLQEPCIEADVTPTTDDIVPATCRYVIPLQAYWYRGVRLFCVPQDLWQSADLHTRLFTFLSLLQRAITYEVVHAWGTVPVLYLAVYTARYLAVPAVISWSGEPPEPTGAAAFFWQWSIEHAAAFVVPQSGDYASFASGRVYHLAPDDAAARQALLALYRRLSATVS